MPRLRTIQTNFSSGELDPKMRFRVDTGAYINGAERIRNGLLYATGGVSRRPGTEHKQILQGKTQLIPFDFADDERNLFAFSDGRLDVYDTDGALVTSVTSGINWTEDDLFELTYSQIADTMIVCHRDWPTQVITRTSLTTFTVADFEFRESANGEKVFQPYFKFADDSVTISCSATSGSGVNITANSAIFTSDWVGTRIRWAQVEILITGFTSTTVLVGTIQGTLLGELDENPFAVTQGSGTVEVTHVAHGFATGDSVTLSGAADTGGVTAAQLNGAKTITVIDDNRYSFASGGTATDSLDGGGPNVKFTGANLPTRNWDEQVFSSVNGYPGAVTFHEGRLWFAGSGGVPDGLWASQIFDYFNFAIEEGLANDSIQITLGSDDISNIRHLVSNGDLQIFSATADFYAFAPQNQALTPTNITIRRQTPFGSSIVRPKVFDGATIYMQASNTGLREFLYSEATQRYASTDLNVLSSHLIELPTNMAILRGTTTRSEQYAFIINDDGTMAVFHSSRSEQLAGWTLWEMAGDGEPKFSSIAVLGGVVWLSVLRDGSYRLEELYEEITNPIDGVTHYTQATATDTWVVDSIYWGKTVAIRSGYYYLGEYEVDASGNVTLDNEVETISVGYRYEFEVKTLPVNLELSTGNMLGLPKKINRVFLGLEDTYAATIQGNRLVIRNTIDDVEEVPTPATGTREFYLLGYSRDAQITISQLEYQPCTVLGLGMEVSF
jgi:hypothetical protein